MNKITRGMLIAGIVTSLVTPVFAKTTIEEVKKIQQSKSNVTVKPVNTYINWKGSRDDLTNNQIIVEFDIYNQTLSDGIRGQYMSDIKNDNGEIVDILEVKGTTFEKHLMVIQDGVELKPTFSSCTLIDSGKKGKMYLVLWTNAQNSVVDIVLGNEITSLSPSSLPLDIAKVLGVEENKFSYKDK